MDRAYFRRLSQNQALSAKFHSRMGPGLPGGGTKLKLGRGFGLQAEVFFLHGGLETTATPGRLKFPAEWSNAKLVAELTPREKPVRNCFSSKRHQVVKGARVAGRFTTATPRRFH